MSIGVLLKGDFAKLSKMQQRLAGKNLAAIRREILDEMAIKAQQQIDRGFDGQRDPHRNKWKKRKRQYAHPILQRTMALREGTTAKAQRRGVSFSYKSPYGRYHMSGTRHMKARKFMPTKTIPKRWRGAYARIVRDVLRKRLG